MANRISSLAGHSNAQSFGARAAKLILKQAHDLQLHQIAAWTDSIGEVEKLVVAAIGGTTAPSACRSLQTESGTLMYVAPLIWWLHETTPPQIPEQLGTRLDLSHAYTLIKISGEAASELLNRHLSLDLRPAAFPPNSVASTELHHTNITLHCTATDYQLFIPRSFALSVWELLLQSAKQFGVEVK